MNTIVTGSDKKLVTFYASYMDILGLEIESYHNVSTGVKHACMNKEVSNLILVLNTKEDYLEYSKLRVYLDEAKKNIIIVYTNDVLLKLVTSSQVVTFNHKDVTDYLATSMAKMNVCRPYMQVEEKEKSPKKVLEHIKFLLTKGNIILPIKNECALNVLAALDNDEVSFRKIDVMTKIDPVLHSSLIKMANSVYFSGSYGQIQNVEKALVRVGIVNVKVFLINFINKSLATNKNLRFSTEIEKAIDDSLRIASLCYVLSNHFKIESKEIMFSIGLLSKLGEIFIYAAISGYLENETMTERNAEDYVKIADSTYHAVSAMMLKKWKFTPGYYNPILNSQKLTANENMEETKVLFLAESLLYFLETQKLDKAGKDALIATGLDYDKELMFKIRNTALKHLESITSMIA